MIIVLQKKLRWENYRTHISKVLETNSSRLWNFKHAGNITALMYKSIKKLSHIWITQHLKCVNKSACVCQYLFVWWKVKKNIQLRSLLPGKYVIFTYNGGRWSRRNQQSTYRSEKILASPQWFWNKWDTFYNRFSCLHRN